MDRKDYYAPNVRIKVLDERLRDQLPQYATPASAGMDLRACLSEPTTLAPGEVQLISTGLSILINDPGFMATLVPRSGLGHKHGIVLGNLIGIIDADYTGPVMLSVWNRGSAPYTIQPLDRIAQMIVIPIARVAWEVVEDFSTASARGEGGFGSTGSS